MWDTRNREDRTMTRHTAQTRPLSYLEAVQHAAEPFQPLDPPTVPTTVGGITLPSSSVSAARRLADHLMGA